MLRRLGSIETGSATGQSPVRHFSNAWNFVTPAVSISSLYSLGLTPGTYLMDVKVQPGKTYTKLATFSRSSSSAMTGAIQAALYEVGDTRYSTGPLVADAEFLLWSRSGPREMTFLSPFTPKNIVYTLAITVMDPNGVAYPISGFHCDRDISAYAEWVTEPFLSTLSSFRWGTDPNIDYTASFPMTTPQSITLTEVAGEGHICPLLYLFAA